MIRLGARAAYILLNNVGSCFEKIVPEEPLKGMLSITTPLLPSKDIPYTSGLSLPLKEMVISSGVLSKLAFSVFISNLRKIYVKP